MNTIDRISQIRNLMKENNIDAYIIPSSDPHMSEYVPNRYKGREWISGFNGSAGTVVITQNKAGLWTDSRYFIQAHEQLKGTGIELFKMGQKDVPSYEQWINSELHETAKVGVDGTCLASFTTKNIHKELVDVDLLSKIWDNRESIPTNKAFQLNEKFSGESVNDKIARVTQYINNKNADYYLITALDEIAWLFNIRGNDIEYNPVVYAFALIGIDSVTLYINQNKLENDLLNKFQKDSIIIKPYHSAYNDLKDISNNQKILIDYAKVNYSLVSNISAQIVEDSSVIAHLKAQKNKIEIEGFKNALIKDGAAMCNFLHWFETTNQEITELDISDKLKFYRSQQDNFVSESFNTIAAFKEHGAITHYAATPESNKKITSNSFVLIDSGAQYLDGTTDITRTLAIGEITNQQKTDYTLVLKGMIELSRAKFPENTKGYNLDILARKHLWQNNMNYGHGTGHGVGAFLNVHEGPQSIRQEFVNKAIEKGMVITNEPGLYREGEYGIRIENIITCVEDCNNQFGSFLKFETLTLCPIDIKPIDIKLLTSEEKEWLNNYHKLVFDKVSPLLNQELTEWLKIKTAPIN